MKTKSALVFVDNDTPLTTSRIVAEKFGKQHRHVLDAIRDLIKTAGGVPKIGQTPMFAETTWTNEQNGQIYPMYTMTRDGFTLLAMGFTGKKALQFKLKFIDAFNRMEQKLRELANLPQPTIEHNKIRRLGITDGRRPATDMIKLFVERDQPDSAGLYYGTYTKETQIKALGIPKGGRENASAVDLALMLLVEKSNANQLAEAYDKGETFFHALYKKCVPRAKQIKDMFNAEGLTTGTPSPSLGSQMPLFGYSS